MARIESRLITRKMPWHANMTEMNHLGAALIAKPHVFESVMTQLFTSQMYSGNTLTAILTRESRRDTIDKRTWEWSLRGASTRPLVSLENINPDSITQLGKFKTEFKLKLDENWYVAGDVIHPGAADKRYQVRIAENPIRHGKGWVYRVRGMWDADSMFLPLRFLDSGTQWSKLYSQYGEGTEQSGSTQFSLPISFANEMSEFRKKYKVTGDVANEVLSVAIPDSNGKMHDSWIKFAEIEYWAQWYRELERADIYTRSAHTVLDENGRPVKSGPGVQEQLEDSHIHKYNVLSARLIEEYLMDIFYNRVAPGKPRHIRGFTGEYGMLQFHRAIQKLSDKRGFLQLVHSEGAIQKASSPYHDNALSYGYQFTQYKMSNGSTLELAHMPLYDDREINTEIDVVTGFPMESQRITFLDFGGKDSSSNIKLLDKKNSFKLGYVAGMHNPYGPNNNKLMSHSGDYYEMHVQKEQGVHIEDVTRCGELILERN